MAAAPVRSLGGAGTYASASSAAASKSSGTTASTRAGVMRVSPSASKTTTTAKSSDKTTATSGTVTSTRAATTPRLSIGKYLPHRVVSSTGSSSSGDSSSDSEFVDVTDPLWVQLAGIPSKVDLLESGLTVLEGRVDVLEQVAEEGIVTDAELKDVQDSVAVLDNQVAEIESAIAALPENVVGKSELQSEIEAVKALIPSADDIAGAADVVQLKTDVSVLKTSAAEMAAAISELEAALATKQNVLSAGDYIEISGDVVSLKYADLVADLEKIAGNTVDVSYDDATHTLTWSIDGVSESATITFDDTYETIANVQAADKLLQESIESLEKRVAVLETKILDFATTAELEAAQTTLAALIDTKIAAGDFATAEQLSAVQTSLKDMSTANSVKFDELTSLLAALETEIQGKQDADDYVLTTTLNTVQSALNSAIEARATTEQVATLKKELEDKIAKVQAGGVDGLENYALQTNVDAADEALQEQITANADAIATKAEAAALTAYALKSELPSATSQLTNDSGFITGAVLTDYALVKDLEAAELLIAALQDADTAMETSIKALQDAGYVDADKLNEKVDELVAADTALSGAIEELEKTIPSIAGLASETYVNRLVADLEAVDTALQDAINAIKQPDVDKAYVDVAVDGLNTSIDGLKSADTNMQAAIETINDTLATLATKSEVSEGLSELQAAIDKINAGDVQLTNYYTKDEADAKFAASADLGALAYADTVDAAQITSIDGSVIENGTITADKISTQGTEMAAGDFAMLVSDGQGGVSWVSVDVE